MSEIWRPFWVCEGEQNDGFSHYQVSNLGRVRRLVYNTVTHKPHIISQSVDKCGYSVVRLHYQGVSYQLTVHRIVAQTFVPNPNGFYFPVHKDGNKRNNTPENLEWRSVPPAFFNCGPRRAKPVRQYGRDGNLIAEFSSASVAARALGVSPQSVAKSCREYEQNCTCCGYFWRYVEDDIDKAG